MHGFYLNIKIYHCIICFRRCTATRKKNNYYCFDQIKIRVTETSYILIWLCSHSIALLFKIYIDPFCEDH